MAGMSTALTEFADNGNSRTYVYTGHTASEPKLVLQKRKIASGESSVIEDTVTVLSSTEDADGVLLASRVSIEVKVRRPVNGISADVDAALVVARDIIAGDEFTNTVATQEWLV